MKEMEGTGCDYIWHIWQISFEFR